VKIDSGAEAKAMSSTPMDPEVREAKRRQIRSILGELETVLAEAQAATRPLEIDPWRSRVFSVFVGSWRGGLIPDEAEARAFADADEDDPDLQLTADSLCRVLAQRWGLDLAAREAQTMQTRLPSDQLERMRLLWSLMRMWMEWSYAWHRWGVQNPPEAADGESAGSD
jgi:hypothetical protein